jgi:hypothetical protein
MLGEPLLVLALLVLALLLLALLLLALLRGRGQLLRQESLLGQPQPLVQPQARVQHCLQVGLFLLGHPLRWEQLPQGHLKYSIFI